MTFSIKNQKTDAIDAYNDDIQKAYMKALTMGSLKRPRATLADLAGLAVNDNNSTKGD